MYIIIWNFGTNNEHVHRDSHKRIETFMDKLDAHKEADACMDGKDFNSYTIFELENTDD